MQSIATLAPRRIARLRTWRQQLGQTMSPTAWALFVLWVGFMIAMPHIVSMGAEMTLTVSLSVSVLLQGAVVLAILWPHWGAAKTVRALAIVAVLSWGMEAIGASTGFPFGSYDYTARLQPQLFHVPLLIPVAWWMMLGPSWAVAQVLASRRGLLVFALFSGLAITAWDLFLDPQMVAWQLWVWETPGGYFGIPWVNYAGWLLTGVLITLVVRPAQLPVLPLIMVYVTTWLLESIGLAFFFGLPGPAAVGFVGMGVFVWAVVRRLMRSQADAEIASASPRRG
ncbi:MAG: carotenoid biosynthesis protein [Caldilineaceae bacterium]|nr:carotenoid biosynthesis protein [Caldilineaceae bacterium]